MTTATITSKGQITIPADVRRALGLLTGSRVDFVYVREGVFEMVPLHGSVRSLRGMIAAPDRAVGLDEMNEAVAREAATGGRPRERG